MLSNISNTDNILFLDYFENINKSSVKLDQVVVIVNIPIIAAQPHN